MSNVIVRPVSAVSILALAACSSVTQRISDATQGATGAAPLETPTNMTQAINEAGSKKQFLLNEITISYNNCEDYKRLLLLSSRSSNLTFDVLTTIFGALGTVFTPISTVHALTAATSISSGTKASLDADVYQNATAPLMVQAIQQTYNVQMDALLKQVETMPDASTGPSDGGKAPSAPAAKSPVAPAAADAPAVPAPAAAKGVTTAPAAASAKPVADQTAPATATPKTPGTSNASVEFADIVRIHSECSLTEAMGTLQSLVQPAQQSKSNAGQPSPPGQPVTAQSPTQPSK